MTPLTETRKPLAVDLCCGLGGWTEGLLSEGWDVLGFDVERHVYGSQRYPAQLVIQDILTLDGRQFRGKVGLIVASPPCQFFSYTAMPWTRAKKLAAEVRADPVRLAKELALFRACVRIGREAECPTVIENVRGAIPWVGRSRTHFGSFHLWGDVPALMPVVRKHTKVPGLGAGWRPPGHPDHKSGVSFNTAEEKQLLGAKVPGFRFDGSGKSFQTASVEGLKHGGNWWDDPTSPGRQGGLTGRKQPGISGPRANGKGDAWFQDGAARHGSKSTARKAASAQIAKIPLALSRHIAAYYFPEAQERSA